MIRAKTRAELDSRIAPGVEALGGTFYRWPTFTDPVPTRVTLVVRDIVGDLALPTFGGDNKAGSEDTWRLDAVCRAEASLQTVEAAEQLAEDLAEVVRTAVHDDPSLGGLSRASGTVGRTWRLQQVLVVRCTGPEVLDFDDGPAGLCVVTLEAIARVY